MSAAVSVAVVVKPQHVLVMNRDRAQVVVRSEQSQVVVHQERPTVVLRESRPTVVMRNQPSAVPVAVGWQGPPGPPGPDTAEAIEDHIYAAEPHPVYDDMATLRLIFENGLI
jgi:hypothetical protein